MSSGNLLNDQVSTNEETAKSEILTKPVKYGINSFDVWAFGITTVIGGQYFSWNHGLTIGAGMYGIVCFLVAMAYIIFICNAGEVTSGLPFAGGCYGFTRCVMGNYWGFMLGCFEIVEYIFYASESMVGLELVLEMTMPDARHYAPVTWGVIIIVSLLIHIFGGKYFWTFNRFIAILTLLIVLLYCFGSMKYVDFSTYAAYASEPNPYFVGNMKDFMKVFPLATWLFIGAESLTLVCDEIDEPKKTVPRGQIACVLTLTMTAILVYFVTVSLSPGIESLVTNEVPFNLGFKLIFGMTDDALVSQYCTILVIPALFGGIVGFVFLYGKIIVAMAESKLLASGLTTRYSRTGNAYVAMIAGAFLCYMVCLLSLWYPKLLLDIYNISLLGAFSSYIMQSLCYILLKYRYTNIVCDMQSPFGIYGALYCMLIWIVGIIAVVGFQDDDQGALKAYVVMFAFFSVWYFAYARYRQSFSDEEKEVYFRIYVVNHNTKKVSKKKFMQNADSYLTKLSSGSIIKEFFGGRQPSFSSSSLKRIRSMSSILGLSAKDSPECLSNKNNAMKRADSFASNFGGISRSSSKVGCIDPAAFTDPQDTGSLDKTLPLHSSTDNLLTAIPRRMSRQYSTRIGIEPAVVVSASASASAAYQVTEDTKEDTMV